MVRQEQIVAMVQSGRSTNPVAREMGLAERR